MRGGAGGLGCTVWAPAGAANGSPPPPILGRSPDVAGALPEITRQREEAKAAAEKLVPETWDEKRIVREAVGKQRKSSER